MPGCKRRTSLTATKVSPIPSSNCLASTLLVLLVRRKRFNRYAQEDFRKGIHDDSRKRSVQRQRYRSHRRWPSRHECLKDFQEGDEDENSRGDTTHRAT